MSSNKKQNIEVVLPAGGSQDQQPAQDPKVYKQNLKNRITTLKTQQKDTQGTIKALERELNKLSSSSSKKTAVGKKEVKIVKKKGRNSKARKSGSK